MCLSFCLSFCTVTDFSAAKKAGAWNFACVLAYYLNRSCPLSVNTGSRGRRHYFQDEWLRWNNCVGAWHGHWGRRRCLRLYSGICVLYRWHVTGPVRNALIKQRSHTIVTRRPAPAHRTARHQFQAVFPVITVSFPTNVIAHLHILSMDLTVGRTVGPAVDSTAGWTVGLTVKLCKQWFDSRSNHWSNCGNHWPTSELNASWPSSFVQKVQLLRHLLYNV